MALTQASDDMRDPILDAVQTALTGFGEQVKVEIDALREALNAEKAARMAAESQVAEIAAALELSAQRLQTNHDEVIEHVDAKADATSAALDQRLEALESWSDASTDAANELETRLAETESQTARLADEITSQLSTRVDASDVATAGVVAAQALFEGRLDTAETRMESELVALHAAVEPLVGADAPVTESRLGEQLAETREQIDQQLVTAEQQAVEQLATTRAQIDEQLAATKTQIDDDVRERLAAVDEEFERVASGAESSVAALNDRANDIDDRLADIIRRVTELETIVAEVDVDVLDDLSERVSAAAGEAVLVRIETERFQESVKETNDQTARRIAEVETQLQAQELDVETAVQLERLEEIERALVELDPSQFVRIDAGTATGEARTDPSKVPFVGSTGETGHLVTEDADESTPPTPTLPTSSG